MYLTDCLDAEKNSLEAKKNVQFTKYKDSSNFKCHNHLGNNYHLANKNALMYNMKAYFEAYGEDPFIYLPLTFHIRNGTEDPEFTKFLEYY